MSADSADSETGSGKSSGRRVRGRVCFTAFLVLLSFACDRQPEGELPAAPDPDAVRARFEGYSIQDLARYVAGKPEELPERLASLATAPGYRKIARRMDAAWKSYEANHLSKIRVWRGELRAESAEASTEVFYPFGGPDAVHPLLIFPDARRYTLVGLERFGRLPVPLFGDPAGAARQVDSIHGAVRGVLGRNFFLTLRMTGTVGSGPDNGVGAILLLFLSRLNFEILDAYPVVLTPEGNIAPAEDGTPALGMRILFRGKDGLPREMNYLQVNLSDANLPKTPGLRVYLKKRRDVTTMLKAASYLMYLDAFDDLRGMILNRSRLILSDSSGMPFHFLHNRGWRLEAFGRYAGPIGLFRLRFEPDRRAFYRRTESRLLPFAYGYHPSSPNLLLARRTGSNSFRPLVFDGDDREGITTFSKNGRLVILGDPKRMDAVTGGLTYPARKDEP